MLLRYFFNKRFLRRLSIVIVILIIFMALFFKFVTNNLDYHYFEFRNNTDREIELIVDYHYIKEGNFSEKIPPFSEIEFVIGGSAHLELKIQDSGRESTRGFYLTMGESFFFKTKFRLEYDGNEIIPIYEYKVDYWF